MRRGLAFFAAVAALSTNVANAGTFKTIFEFGSVWPGAIAPLSGLVGNPSTALYGTASSTGSGQYNGAVYKLTPASGSWKYSPLHLFGPAPDGGMPWAGLTFDATGNLFGTTTFGGPTGIGSIFELKKTAASFSYRQISGLQGAKGMTPSGDLVVDKDGTIYGTAGALNSGGSSIFKLVSKDGGASFTYSEIVAFPATPARVILAGVTIGPDGNLYGTTYSGGSFGYGNVFQLVKPTTTGARWAFKVLHSFSGMSDGANPIGGVAFLPDGRLVGTTGFGGAVGYGNVFAMQKTATGAWTFRVLKQFQGGPDGATPAATLTVDASGNIYGTTLGGGKRNGACFAFIASTNISSSGCGVLFKMTKATSSTFKFATLHQFNGADPVSGADEGSNPVGRLLIGSDGKIYGTTMWGRMTAKQWSAGTVFTYTP